MRRGTLVAFGIFGWLLSIGGGLVAGIYSSDNAACGTTAGVLARSASQTAQNSCVLYGTLYTLGIVLAAIGVVLLAGWVFLLIRTAPGERHLRLPKPGFYDVPGRPGERAYWDGARWRPNIPEP